MMCLQVCSNYPNTMVSTVAAELYTDPMMSSTAVMQVSCGDGDVGGFEEGEEERVSPV